ncbi:MAG: pantetheine-phosphate adenylyltransferase, partial [Chitinophaga sp.]
MQRICLFPGTFDPVTLGHTDIIDRALPLFDELVIGIGVNAGKEPMFSMEQRVEWIREIYRGKPSIRVTAYEGLTVNFCKQIG